MSKKLFAALSMLVLLVALLPASTVGAGREVSNLPIPVDIDSRLKGKAAPEQLSPEEADAVVTASTTTESQCLGNDEFLTITITSFDPANPGSQNVVFWRETADPAPGKATLWVAWDFLTTAYGRQDVITCDQLAYMQSKMDDIVATDVKYFGQYVERPDGNENIDVMIYNIVDESSFDPDYPFYIAGFFWSGINEEFDRNMIFIDSLDWANRIGPDAPRAYLYEGTVAHELEHLIHNDQDFDEDSWVDEGLADMAEYFNGFGHPDGHVVYYLAYHRTPLTIWGGGLESYGASYLFQLYLLENFGQKDNGAWDPGWTLGLVSEDLNSIAGVEAQTGAQFNDLFDAWMVANYFDDPSQNGAGDFPIGYEEIDLAPYVSPTYGPWSIKSAITDIYGSDHHGNLPTSRYYGGYISGTVEFPQGELPAYAPWYGSYKGIQPQMNIQLAGAMQSGVAPKSGNYEAASGGGHLVTDRMLTLNTPVGGTLNFWTWYDIEEEWDYGFVEASTDGGATWAPLLGSITRISNNPNNSTAWANSLIGGQTTADTVITGNSGGWVPAEFILPAASGVLVRFSYYTDEATNGQGWFIDDVAVNGFSDGFEAGAGNWIPGGWSITTGLFANDWIAGFVNPIYNKGKLQNIAWSYLDGTPGTTYEIISTMINTSNLNKDSAVVFFANRPGENPFATFYQLLVNK